MYMCMSICIYIHMRVCAQVGCSGTRRVVSSLDSGLDVALGVAPRLLAVGGTLGEFLN